MKIVERLPHERGKGLELGQWLAGCVGAMLTTLPSFLVLPFWFWFVGRYKIVDEAGNDDAFACGFVCFSAGMIVWIVAIVAFAWRGE